MSDRLKRISDLLGSQKSRTAYIKSKLGVLVPAQIRSLRLKSINPPMPYQRDLAHEADLHQSRISMFETPGAANITIETLAKIAAALRVGVIIKFVPFSEMLRWENSFSSETDVVRLPNDNAFLAPLHLSHGQEHMVSQGDWAINQTGAMAPSMTRDVSGALYDFHGNNEFTGTREGISNAATNAA